MKPTCVFFDLGDTLVRANRKWMPDAPQLLGSLKASGLTLGIISNTDTLDQAHLLPFLPPDFSYALFNEGLVILSAEVGFEKPDPRIFSLAVDRAHRPAAQCVFLTEDPKDVLVSQSIGMLSLRLFPTGELNKVPDYLQVLG